MEMLIGCSGHYDYCCYVSRPALSSSSLLEMRWRASYRDSTSTCSAVTADTRGNTADTVKCTRSVRDGALQQTVLEGAVDMCNQSLDFTAEEAVFKTQS